MCHVGITESHHNISPACTWHSPFFVQHVALFIKGKNQNTYQTLGQTAVRLKNEFEGLIKKCSDKITEMRKVEKETWIKLDQLEEDCQG